MNAPNRILITTSTFPTSADDRVTARFVLDLAQHLTAHARVFVLAPAGSDADPREKLGDVVVERFQYFIPRRWQRLSQGEGMVAAMRSGMFARAQAPLYVAAQWRSLIRLIRTERIDLVNAHWIVPQGVVAASLRRRLSVPLVVSAHGADVAWLGRSAGGATVARWVFDRADGFIADSQYLATRTEEIVGRPIPHVAIPMGVAVSKFRPVPSSTAVEDSVGTNVLFVGKLVPKKGVRVLLEATALLVNKHPALRVVIVGGGPLEAELRAHSNRLNLSDVVRFEGWVRNDRLPSLYAAASVVCIPSIQDQYGETEGTPVVLQEAMASGAVVVASRTSGIPDVIEHGMNGWSVPPGDAPKLAAELDRALAASAEERLRIRTAAAKTAQSHSWARVAARHYDAFREAVARAPVVR